MKEKSQIPNPKYQNKVEEIFSRTGTCAGYARGYFSYLSGLFGKIDARAVERVAVIFEKARAQGKQIFFMGNGGSAATASHFANDLGKGARVGGQAPFKAVSLTDNVSLITALANDEGYDEIFVAQLENLLNPGDVVVAISASGDSPNVVKAIEYANTRGAKTVGLTGFSGGRLKEVAHLCILVGTPQGEYGPVEDIHLILDHIVTSYLKMVLEREGR